MKSGAPPAGVLLACKHLSRVGGAGCVPALAAMVARGGQVAPVARYALERITAPEAGQALRAELARAGWSVDYIAVRNGLGLRIPHPEGFDHPNLLIVLGAAKLGNTRLIDNVDVVPKHNED